MYKLTVKITNKEGVKETVVNDFKTVKDAKKYANGLYDFTKDKVEKEPLSVSRNNWAEWNERHCRSMTIYNEDKNNFTIAFTVEKQ